MADNDRWIAGINAAASVLEHEAISVLEVMIEARARNPRLAELAERARGEGIAVRSVGSEVLDRMSGGVRHQGIVLRCAAARSLDENDLMALLEATERPLLLVLDGVQDPHNLGACLRTAAAAGVTAVVIPKDKAAPVNATVRKTSAGAADRIPVVSVTNLARTLKKLQELGVWIYGLDGEAPATIHATDLKGNIALVMGGEGEGMRRLTRETCDGLVRIPMPGEMESLNVSVATGIALFEVVRQRGGGL